LRSATSQSGQKKGETLAPRSRTERTFEIVHVPGLVDPACTLFSRKPTMAADARADDGV
jgi:hypothetical protein